RYERRPSAWIEPIGDWGEGAVHLVEIPTTTEINDNIVSFWRPRAPTRAKGEYVYTYRIHWCARLPKPLPLAQVAAPRIGAGCAATGGAGLPASRGAARNAGTVAARRRARTGALYPTSHRGAPRIRLRHRAAAQRDCGLRDVSRARGRRADHTGSRDPRAFRDPVRLGGVVIRQHARRRDRDGDRANAAARDRSRHAA